MPQRGIDVPVGAAGLGTYFGDDFPGGIVQIHFAPGQLAQDAGNLSLLEVSAIGAAFAIVSKGWCRHRHEGDQESGVGGGYPIAS